MDVKKTKVVFFFFGTDHFNYGVAEVFRRLMNEISKDRYDIYLIFSGSLNSAIKGINNNIKLIELNQKSLKKSFLPLKKTIENISPDILVSGMEHPNILSVLIKFFSTSKFKLILTCHNVFTPRLENMWNRRDGFLIKNLVRFFYPSADHIVCVSQSVESDLIKYLLRHVNSSVIYNPVLESQQSFPMNKFEKEKGLIVIASRLVDFKKVDYVVRALALLDSGFRLIILGDGQEMDSLKILADELKISNRIEFKGYVENPFDFYRRAEIFVLPSMWEGFGNVLIESMYCGCQVIVSSLSEASTEVVGYGEYGYIYDGNDINDLASKIYDARHQPKSVAKLVKYASTFTTERAVREYETIFELVAKK
jgi:glycosyltransferase involved in cell wall biosynthesis